MKKLYLPLIVIFLFACSKPESGKTKLFLDWTPNTNHTGIFVAQELGFYKELGVDLEILLPGKTTAEMIVATNRADFAISFQSHLIEAKDKGLPLVSIAAIIQHSTSGYASPKDRNITTPIDFQHKNYGAYGSDLERIKLDLIMRKNGVTNPDINIVQLGNSDFFAATKKHIDFVNIFYGWTGIEAEIKGYPINFINTADYAKELDTYEPIIITNKNLIKNNPDLINRFIKATKKGYEYAINYPKESAKIVIKLYPELNPDLVYRSQEWLARRYIDDAAYWGVQDKQRWDSYIEFSYAHNIIKTKLSSEDLFTNEFISGD